jgi:hypothetical protein
MYIELTRKRIPYAEIACVYENTLIIVV